ncbi:MAG TPA: glycosyltransferase family 2 protein [Trueperaceae bacterium]
MSPVELAEAAVLLYFCLVCLGYGISLPVAARHLSRTVFDDNAARYNDLLRHSHHRPISILVPAYNEEATIVSSVSNFLSLHYPTFEVIVIDDGSSDGTLGELQRAFQLTPVEPQPLRLVPHHELLGAYRSELHPKLLVLSKRNGGKADALNAGINQSQYPLFCSVDADSLLDAGALLGASFRFIDDPRLIALGGTIRVLNNCRVVSGAVEAVRAPRSWLERIQVIEYTRAFLTGRATLSSLGMLVIISGAFGLFRRQAVVEAGGYRRDTVGEDAELVLRLHRRMREQRRRYRIEYHANPICWTQVPNSWRSLRRQRDRWHRGLLETLWIHRAMTFNPRYGPVGLFALPYFWFFEALSPLIEVGGYVLAAILLVRGSLSPEFAAGLLIVAVCYGMLVGLGSLGLEVFMRDRYSRTGDRVRLLAACLAENLGYRQWISAVRASSMVTVFLKRGSWGAQHRTSLESSPGPG